MRTLCLTWDTCWSIVVLWIRDTQFANKENPSLVEMHFQRFYCNRFPHPSLSWTCSANYRLAWIHANQCKYWTLAEISLSTLFPIWKQMMHRALWKQNHWHTVTQRRGSAATGTRGQKDNRLKRLKTGLLSGLPPACEGQLPKMSFIVLRLYPCK